MNLLDLLIPLYLLISLGFFLKKYQFPSQEFWPGIEKMIYYILFPVLVFVAILKAPIDSSLIFKLIIVTLVPVLLSGLLQFTGFISPKINGATFSSMYQGAVRNNTAISLVIVAWLLPDTGLASMAVIILIMVPMNNLTSILVLLRYGNNTKESSLMWWFDVIKNPLIIASALGLIFNILNIGLPISLINTADFLGRSALPFALLIVGAGLKFGSFFDNKLAIAISSFGGLVVAPVISWGLCTIMGIEADLAKVVIIFSAMPTAVSSYILAKQMGGDAEGMAQIITFQTVAAALTLPVILLLLQNI